VNAWRSNHVFSPVLVIATPYPLLLAIPVAVIGAVSLSAKRGIIIKNPAALEQIDSCRTFMFDKTGTLTYGKPSLTGIVCAQGVAETEIPAESASLERYSKHPLAKAIVDAAQQRGYVLRSVAHVSERPGAGLRGALGGSEIFITGRNKLSSMASNLPPQEPGLECLVFRNGAFAALFGFEDLPRADSQLFIDHLSPRHRVAKLILASGDREPEVRALAAKVGIKTALGARSPEEKVELVRSETHRGKTVFIGDGINDAPAMQAVGIAFGHENEITSEAADAVVLNQSFEKVDELIHIGRRMRRIALESAVGGMVLSGARMLFAACGLLSPLQEPLHRS